MSAGSVKDSDQSVNRDNKGKKMNKPFDSEKLRKKITQASMFSNSLTVIIVAILAVLALAKIQTDREYDMFAYSSRTHLQEISRYIKRLKDITEQVTSRTRARKILMSYLSEEVTKEEANKRISPILQDALEKTSDLLGITRITKSGEVLSRVGVSIPKEIWMELLGKKTRIEGPIFLEELGVKSHVIVSAPIIDNKRGHVGYDIVLYNLGYLGVTEQEGLEKWNNIQIAKNNGKVIKAFFPEKTLTALPKDFLSENHISTQIQFTHTDKHIVAHGLVPGSPQWVFLHPRHKMIFYETIIWSSLYTILALFIIALMSFLLLRRFLSPLLEQVAGVHEIIALKNEVEKQRNKAVQASKFKSNFLAQMSHEIRTPLSSIIGMGELLSLKHSEKEKDQYVKAITNSGDILLHLVNDILDLSKIESGQLVLEKIVYDLQDVLRDSTSIMKLQAEKKGLSFNCVFPREESLLTLGDPTRLKQILINFLSNAIKFTKQGMVTLSCKVENNQLIFKVEDTGIGIPEDKMDALFSEYKQVSTSTTREFGGTGLGLAISNKLVKKMGGKIEITSKVNEGSSFSFSLPFVEVGSSSVVKVKSDSFLDGADFSNLSILIVDDTSANRELMKAYCKTLGCPVEFAHNGEEAVEKVLNSHYDIVFMDLQMPVMGGKEAMAILQEKNYRNPVIVLSAGIIDGNMDDLKKIGFCDILVKPLRLNEFSLLLKKWRGKK